MTQSFYSLCQLCLYCLSAPNSPSSTLLCDTRAGACSRLHFSSVGWLDGKLANREGTGGRLQGWRRKKELFFLFTLYGFSPQWQEGWHLEVPALLTLPTMALCSVAGLPLAKIIYHRQAAPPIIRQQSTPWQWAACATGSCVLSSEVWISALWGPPLQLTLLQLWGKRLSAAPIPGLLRVFYPFHLVNNLIPLYLKFSLFRLLLIGFWLLQSPKKSK